MRRITEQSIFPVWIADKTSEATPISNGGPQKLRGNGSLSKLASVVVTVAVKNIMKYLHYREIKYVTYQVY